MASIATQIKLIRERIQQAEQTFGRDIGSVKLLAVTKTQSVANIKAAAAAGQQAFGENYLQEALIKIKALASEKLEWHFIGHVQANKTKDIATYFDWVHGVDRLKIAARLNEQRPAYLPPLNVCIEVKLSDEANKTGVALSEIGVLAGHIKQLSRLKLRGLMAIPAPSHTLIEQRRPYHVLRQVFQELNGAGFGLDTLSMGMSNDFEAAIAEGSTLVRIGTFIFGERK